MKSKWIAVILAGFLSVSLQVVGCGGGGEAENGNIALPGGGKLVIVAGNGARGFAGEGGPATEAELNIPSGLAWDADGNLYIGQDYRISKANAGSGVLTTVAGTGEPGYSGDGGPARKAELGILQELAFDTDGNLYFADWGSNTIRRINANGVITTLVGTGTSGFSPDGTPAAKASLNKPFGLAFGSDGRLYFSDGDNHRVRRLETDGTITTVAGTGEARESGDGGPARNARLAFPRDIAFDADGNLYIGSHGGSRIRVVDPTGIISTAVATIGAWVAPDGSGNLYIGDWQVAIKKWNEEGGLQVVLEAGTYGSGEATTTVKPGGVALDSEGNVYVSDQEGCNCVYRLERR